MDEPAYKISMNVCLNFIPIETGALLRRPGTRHVGTTRGGVTGRLIPFAFEQAFPYVMNFTDGTIRFTTGPAYVMTNDAQTIVAISAANPAVVQTVTAHGWSTGDTVMFNSLGINNPLLQNRQFTIAVVDTTHVSIADTITGATIDGSTIGAFISGNIARILEIATGYTAGSWLNLRSVQAETRTLLLNGTHPQVLQVANFPTAGSFATFSYGPGDFIDGPYLDPIANSVMSSSALNGVVTLTFSFAAYDSTKAYNGGDFVTSVGVCYKSLTALNQNNTPASSPGNWAVVNGGAAINGGSGFVTSDIGRLLRLFSEPVAWTASGTYVTGNVVFYPDGQGGNSYWTATGSIGANVQPGTSTLWALNATGATWTWAQIVTVSGAGLINPAIAIGDLAGGGGLAAAFDGTTSKGFPACATFSVGIVTYPAWSAVNWSSGALCQYAGGIYQAQYNIIASNPYNPWVYGGYYTDGMMVSYQGFAYEYGGTAGRSTGPPPGGHWILMFGIDASPPASPYWAGGGTVSSPVEDVYVGQHYGTATAIQSATLYPSSDIGLANTPNGALPIAINLRASNSAPLSPSSGTLLGSVTTANIFSATTVVSSDRVSTWTYIWFEIVASYVQPLPDNGSHVFTAEIGVAQAQFYAPNVANGSVITAQIRGPALLYNQTINTWQLGVYSDTTGWPTCGAYHEGRIWLGGVVSNRFDACVSNGFAGTEIDFTPTSPDGTVSASNSISYICDGEDSNLIEWFMPDQQGLLFGSQAGEWLIAAPGAGALAPNNIRAVRVTRIGCGNTEPRRAEHTVLFIQKFGRKLMEYFPDVFSGKFTAPHLSERFRHLTVNTMLEIAYQQELAPIVWMRRADGALIGATYKRDTLMTSQGPTIIGGHRHQLGSGRTVESICTGPSVGGNLENLSLLTNDPSTGIRHIEIMNDLLDENFQLVNCAFLDNAIVPSSTEVNLGTGLSAAWSALTTYAAGAFVTYNGNEYVSIATGNLNNIPSAAGSTSWLATPYGSLTVNGLWDHNGKTVTAFIAGLDCGDFVVVSGSIHIPFGDGVSGGTASGLFTPTLVNSFATLPALAGFTYNSDGQLVRPVTQADTGAREGPGFGKLGRQHRAAAMLYGCVNGSISFGTDFSTLYPAKLLQPNGTPYTPQQLWKGIWRDNVNSIYDFDNMISFRVSRPLPAFVIAVGGFDAKADA